jgi:uncharacterized membrane protein (UPF0182 family)
MARRYSRGPFDPFDQPPFGGFREVQIPRPPRRFWIGLGFVAAAFLVVLLTAPVVGFLTEIQWFDALGLRGVYLNRVGLQLLLFFSSLLISFLFAVANLVVALRVRSGRALRAVGIRQRTLWSLPGAIGLGASAVIALILSGSVGSRWQELALFLHASGTGVKEPVFGLDVSFYLLTLPFLHDVLSWLFGLVFLVILLSAGLYAWRGDSFDLRLPPPAIAHLSILLGGLALVLGISAFLGRYDLLYAHNGVVWGAGYADVNARAGLSVLQAILGVLLAALLIANVVPRRPLAMVLAVVVWIGASIVAGIYPAVIQSVSVRPNEVVQEAPYIQREIQFTRRAFAVNDVQTRTFAGDAPLTAQAVADDQATIQNLRLWDNRQLQDTYQQLQSFRTYYTFRDIELDRYPINGRTTQLEISARQLDPDRLPPQAQSWVNQKLEYTHGYGVAASPVSAVVGEGLPDYVVKDIPPAGDLKIDRPQIYFGLQEPTYVLVPSVQQEFDYPKGEDNARTSYAGTHGVPLAAGNRLLWSLRTGDFNMLVSGQVQDRTQILYRRDIQDRVSAIAPFLQFRENPYVVVVDGRLYWIQDAYTGAYTYPYSQQEDTAGGQNYLRNSVKAVVDAYDGTVSLYESDPSDPIIRAYGATFPGLLQPMSKMPPGLRAHLRVPSGQFQVQSQVYSTYHVTDPVTFYNREDVWQPALDPYYIEMRLPGEPQPEYLQIIPFTPYRKQNLVSWLAVRNDPDNYGQMVSYVLSKDKVVLGPQQIAARILQTPEVSRDLTLLNQQGSQVIQGNLLVVPIGNSFLYFEPWYLKSNTTSQSLPELKKVILVDASTSGSVAYQSTLDLALTQIVGKQIVTGTSNQQQAQTGGGTTTGPSPPSASNPTVVNLLNQAAQHYSAAQDALKAGDLATYQKEINQVGQLVQQAQAAAQGGAPAPTTTPTPRS